MSRKKIKTSSRVNTFDRCSSSISNQESISTRGEEIGDRREKREKGKEEIGDRKEEREERSEVSPRSGVRMEKDRSQWSEGRERVVKVTDIRLFKYLRMIADPC